MQVTPASDSATENYPYVTKAKNEKDLLSLTLFDDVKVNPVSDSSIEKYFHATKANDYGDLVALTLFDDVEITSLSNSENTNHIHPNKANNHGDLIALSPFAAQVTPEPCSTIKNSSHATKAVNEGDVPSLTCFDVAQINPITLPKKIKKSELQNYSKGCKKYKKTLKKKLRMHELPPVLQKVQRSKNRIAARRSRQLKKSKSESLTKVSLR